MVRWLQQNKYLLAFSSILSIYIINLFLDVMEVDAAQYATISMEMSQTGSYLHVFEQGKDYLDKPPLLFWLSSWSMQLFGINNFAYKFPSFLIAVLGIYSTYRLAMVYYLRKTAILAALILATTQALFLMTNDVRTDTALLGFSVFSVWHLVSYLHVQHWRNLILSSIGVGLAMLAKGPIALIIPMIVIGSFAFFHRDWKKLIDFKYLVALLIIGIILSPMLYGLYTQYDLHPEKEVYGLKGPSGIKFYFWTQSFGRITGDNYWSNDTGYFFFTHTILWDFFPWILLFIVAFYSKIKSFFLARFYFTKNVDVVTLPLFFLLFIAFSFSRYKLPHYIFVTFPYAAIVTSDFIHRLSDKAIINWSKFYFILLHVVWIGITIAFVWFFPINNLWLPLILIAGLVIYYLVFFEERKIDKLVLPIVVASIVLNLTMATYFYPNLLQYQSSSHIGRYIKEKISSQDSIQYFHHHSKAADFYSHRIIRTWSDEELMSNMSSTTWLITSDEGLSKLQERGVSYSIKGVWNHFHITALKLPFLLQKTRQEHLDNKYLVKLNK